MNIWSKIGNWLRKVWEGIFAALRWLWDLLKPAFEGVFRAISLIGPSVFVWVYGLLIVLIELASGYLGDLFTGVFDVFQAFVPTESVSFSGIFSSNQQALAWAFYDYCAIDFLIERIGAFIVIISSGGVIRYTVWIGRKVLSLIRGAGV